MIPALCPDERTLQALLWSDNPDDASEWQQHLENCERCRQKLQRLAADDDSWADAARLLGPGGPSTPLPGGPALERAMARLKRDDLSAFCQDTEAPADAVGEEEPDLSFLRPPDQPNLLGYLGTYEVRSLRGRGGMGVVFQGFDPSLQRMVAIKVLVPHLAGNATARRRFLREGRSAAAITHDHVVPIYEVAEANGLPYLVMQFVPGISLQEKLDREGPQPLAEVVRIGMQTASGLAAAHAQGLIHRDVKPANILLEDGVARVKITDFGLARLADDASLTQSGTVSGTPQYMAPEQARGEPLDHRADLFSLGSVLYALCTGRPPFRAATSLAVLRRVSDEEPRPLRTINPEVPEWLEEIIRRLHAKDPNDRFASAAEVATLLERHLAHLQQPTTFPQPSRLAGPREVRPRRRLGTRRWLAVAAVLLAASGLTLTEAAGVTHLTRSAAGLVRRPGRQDTATEPAGGAVVPPDLVARGPGEDPPLASGQGTVLRTSQELWVAQAEGVAAGAYAPNGKFVVTTSWDGTTKVWEVPGHKERLSIPGVARTLRSVAVSPDSKTIATAAADKVIRLWDASTGEPKGTLTGHVGAIRGLAFSPDGKTLASAGGEFRRAGELKLWDLATGKERVPVFPFSKELWGLAYAPDGKSVAVGTGDGDVRIVDVATGKVQATFPHPAYVRRVAYSPDGKTLAVDYGEEGFVVLYDLASGESRSSFQAHRRPLFTLAFSPNGKQLLTSSVDGTAVIWDVTRSQVKPVLTLACGQGQVFFAAFSPEGTTVATGGDDHTVRLWRIGDE